MDIKEKIKRYTQILRENNTITISTSSKDGKLWSTKAYYGEENGYIYVILENKGRAFNNIKQNPNIFFVIEKGDPIKFIQGEGIVEIIGHIDLFEKERTYVVRKNFPMVGFLKAVRDCSVVRIRPTKVYVSDFSKGFIPRFEIEFDDQTFKLLQEIFPKQSKIRTIVQATRPWSIGITVVAVLIGSLLSPKVNVLNFMLTMLGAVLVHLGVNAWNDYFDYKKGADKWDTLGSSRAIVDGLMKPKEVFILSSSLILIAALIGLVISTLTGPKLYKIILVGGFLGVFYTLVPIGLKYIALGDLAVFSAWSLISVGSYYVQTSEISIKPFLAFLPVALLIVGILQGNNMRDIQDDKKSGYFTVATILGSKGSQIYYVLLIISAYISILIMIFAKVLPIWSLISFITIPNAIRNINWATKPNYVQYGMLPMYTAQLSTNVGLMIIISLIIERVVG